MLNDDSVKKFFSLINEHKIKQIGRDTIKTLLGICYQHHHGKVGDLIERNFQ